MEAVESGEGVGWGHEWGPGKGRGREYACIYVSVCVSVCGETEGKECMWDVCQHIAYVKGFSDRCVVSSGPPEDKKLQWQHGQGDRMRARNMCHFSLPSVMTTRPVLR